MDESSNSAVKGSREILGVTFSEDGKASVSIKLGDSAKRRQLRLETKRQELEEAALYNSIDSKVFKVKAKTMAAIGTYADKLGIKKIGHGRIFVAGEYADSAIGYLDGLVQELRNSDVGCPPEILVDLIQLKLGFTKVLIDSGESHLKADRMVDGDGKGKGSFLAFPAGQSIMVAVGPQQPKQTTKIEDKPDTQ